MRIRNGLGDIVKMIYLEALIPIVHQRLVQNLLLKVLENHLLIKKIINFLLHQLELEMFWEEVTGPQTGFLKILQ